MAGIIQQILEELQLGRKLISVTVDNASLNTTMVSDLYYGLSGQFEDFSP